MISLPPLPATQWLVLSMIISFVLSVNCFQTNSQIIRRIPQIQSSHRIQNMMMSSSFQQARLAEQLRLSTKQRQFSNNSQDISISQTEKEDITVVASAEDMITLHKNKTITFSTPELEARELLELEKQDSLDDYNAPMMTYQKYLTMQVCRFLLYVMLILFLIRCYML